ncbi:hypothetical protein VNO77_44798 [Canavalia gladiata]|uniref:Uncharacterized protein n=1 Tax=Canavalia gladiata TaxID=3824 RepID=A0AAN9JYV7_CANGL
METSSSLLIGALQFLMEQESVHHSFSHVNYPYVKRQQLKEVRIWLSAVWDGIFSGVPLDVSLLEANKLAGTMLSGVSAMEDFLSSDLTANHLVDEIPTNSYQLENLTILLISPGLCNNEVHGHLQPSRSGFERRLVRSSILRYNGVSSAMASSCLAGTLNRRIKISIDSLVVR